MADYEVRLDAQGVHRAEAARDVATSAGCWTSVRVSFSIGPSKQTWATSSRPRRRPRRRRAGLRKGLRDGAAHAYVLRALARGSRRRFSCASVTPDRVRRSPRQAGSHPGHEHPGASRRRPSRTPWARQSGIEADEVFP
jgi:hypothetical protein